MLKATLLGSGILALACASPTHANADDSLKDWEAADITIIQKISETSRPQVPNWYLATQDARQAILALKQYLATSKDDDHYRYYVENISKFRFQAIGIYYKDKKQIMIEGICKSQWKPYMLRELVGIQDGGPCYFEALYAVDEASFTEFFIHPFGWPEGGPK